jgi:hypothetical protein
MHNFTPEDLLQYCYNETSPEKTAAIKLALETDWTLREKLEVIKSGQARLEKLTLSPRPEAIDKIMAYAEKAVNEVSATA